MLKTSWRLSLITCLLLCVAITVYYSVISDAQLPDHRLIAGFNDLVLHFVAFFSLGLLAALIWPARSFIVAVGLSTAAISIEIVQAFGTTHEASFADCAAGFAGIAFGILFAKVLRKVVVAVNAGIQPVAGKSDRGESRNPRHEGFERL